MLPNNVSFHEQWMQRALSLGIEAYGHTGDNPNVGAVVVYKNQCMGEGYTQAPGKNHAEVEAIEAAEKSGYSVEGAYLYVTVEPCCFHGRTPACTDLIISKKFSKVFVGIQDPHPRVQGRGCDLLKNAGIDVHVGLCASEIQHALKDWLQAYL